MTARILKAKALRPGPSRRERRSKQDAKAERKKAIALVFTEAARKLAGKPVEAKPEPPKKPPKPLKQQPEWMDKQEAMALGWSWRP